MDFTIKDVHQNNPDNDFVLAYADDIAQTAPLLKKLISYITRWNASFNSYDLKLNIEQTEVLVVSRTQKDTVVTLLNEIKSQRFNTWDV